MRANWKDFWYEFWKQKRLFSIVFFPFLAAYIFPWTDQRQLTVVIFCVQQERVDDNFLLAKISNFTNNVHFFSFRIMQNKQSPPFVQERLIWCCPSSWCQPAALWLFTLSPELFALFGARQSFWRERHKPKNCHSSSFPLLNIFWSSLLLICSLQPLLARSAAASRPLPSTKPGLTGPLWAFLGLFSWASWASWHLPPLQVNPKRPTPRHDMKLNKDNSFYVAAHVQWPFFLTMWSGKNLDWLQPKRFLNEWKSEVSFKKGHDPFLLHHSHIFHIKTTEGGKWLTHFQKHSGSPSQSQSLPANL